MFTYFIVLTILNVKIGILAAYLQSIQFLKQNKSVLPRIIYSMPVFPVMEP